MDSAVASLAQRDTAKFQRLSQRLQVPRMFCTAECQLLYCCTAEWLGQAKRSMQRGLWAVVIVQPLQPSQPIMLVRSPGTKRHGTSLLAQLLLNLLLLSEQSLHHCGAAPLAVPHSACRIIRCANAEQFTSAPPSAWTIAQCQGQCMLAPSCTHMLMITPSHSHGHTLSHDPAHLTLTLTHRHRAPAV